MSSAFASEGDQRSAARKDRVKVVPFVSYVSDRRARPSA